MLNFSIFVYLLSPLSFANEALSEENIVFRGVPSVLNILLIFSVICTELITVVLTRYFLARAVVQNAYWYVFLDVGVLFTFFYVLPAIFFLFQMGEATTYPDYNAFTYSITDFGDKDPNPLILVYFLDAWGLLVAAVTPALNVCIFINELLRLYFAEGQGIVLAALILPTFSLCLPTFMIILTVTSLHYQVVARPLFWLVSNLNTRGMQRTKNAATTVFMFTTGFASIVGIWGG